MLQSPNLIVLILCDIISNQMTILMWWLQLQDWGESHHEETHACISYYYTIFAAKNYTLLSKSEGVVKKKAVFMAWCHCQYCFQKITECLAQNHFWISNWFIFFVLPQFCYCVSFPHHSILHQVTLFDFSLKKPSDW